MALTGKQRAALRKAAQGFDAILQIGKDGITENTLKAAEEALDARELIKGTVLQNSPLTAREACDALCKELKCEGISVLGRKFVIYRRSERLKEKKHSKAKTNTVHTV